MKDGLWTIKVKHETQNTSLKTLKGKILWHIGLMASNNIVIFKRPVRLYKAAEQSEHEFSTKLLKTDQHSAYKKKKSLIKTKKKTP